MELDLEAYLPGSRKGPRPVPARGPSTRSHRPYEAETISYGDIKSSRYGFPTSNRYSLPPGQDTDSKDASLPSPYAVAPLIDTEPWPSGKKEPYDGLKDDRQPWVRRGSYFAGNIDARDGQSGIGRWGTDSWSPYSRATSRSGWHKSREPVQQDWELPRTHPANATDPYTRPSRTAYKGLQQKTEPWTSAPPPSTYRTSSAHSSYEDDMPWPRRLGTTLALGLALYGGVKTAHYGASAASSLYNSSIMGLVGGTIRTGCSTVRLASTVAGYTALPSLHFALAVGKAGCGLVSGFGSLASSVGQGLMTGMKNYATS